MYDVLVICGVCHASTQMQAKSGSTVPSIINRMHTTLKIPTYFRTNEFTGSFQAIVDAYVVASTEKSTLVSYRCI